MKQYLLIFVCLFVLKGLYGQILVTENRSGNDFELVGENNNASIVLDEKEDSLVSKVARLFQADIAKVTGRILPIKMSLPAGRTVIIVGTVTSSSLIHKLSEEGKIAIAGLRDQWEGYQVQVVKHPFKGVEQALVVAGSDRRGVAYGLLEISKLAGVSPWYWWADVPIQKKRHLYVHATSILHDAPKVKYRGIFLNDEAPALSGWAYSRFGGFNHRFYENVFELLLRLKGNYLWPAMWGNAFNDDDKMNPVWADQWGIVMGTSHHEPMLRAQQEWKRYGHGPWDYTKNDSALRSFWKTGIQNMGDHESIITIGMRGDGDEPMTEGTAISLLERIVGDQRNIIEQVTGKTAADVPQLWALYKEVQDYYDKGMRVPDDVTLLLCDDNWGNIRKLPRVDEPKRKGGYGIYYHFDYVGGPRNYKWINTNNIARVWEQMHMAYAYGVDRIWIVNVGDLKPMELPIAFFLDYAWNPDRWSETNLTKFYEGWAAIQFGKQYSIQIGDILRRYSQLSSRRKPELLDENTYSLTNYHEADRVLNEWMELEKEVEKVKAVLPALYKDAYFQLVLHPVKAFTNLHALYYAVAMNRYYAAQNSQKANGWANKAKAYYRQDSMLGKQYHNISGGKWNHMMDQTHIGYTYWQQPEVNKMPDVVFVPGVKNSSSINRSKKKVLEKDVSTTKGYSQKKGYISREAANWSRAVDNEKLKWKVIPGIGKTGSGVTTFPVTMQTILTKGSPHLEYDINTSKTGKIKIDLYFSPTLNFHNSPGGLQFAVSLDDADLKIVSLNKENDVNTWNQWVANNIIIKSIDLGVYKPGKHTVKYWMMSPGIVLQKLVIDLGGVKPGYLGPPDTTR